MDEIVFCPRCAWIGHSYDKLKDRANYRICCECHTPLVETIIPISEDPVVGTHDWYELRRKIYKEMIEPLGQLDSSLQSYKYFYNEYFGNAEKKENEFWEIQKLKKEIEEKQKETLPHCPTCNSIKLQKISTGNKVGSAALFGVFAIGHVNKTYKCLNCGYKW